MAAARTELVYHTKEGALNHKYSCTHIHIFLSLSFSLSLSLSLSLSHTHTHTHTQSHTHTHTDPEELFGGACVEGSVSDLRLLGEILGALYGRDHPLQRHKRREVG